MKQLNKIFEFITRVSLMSARGVSLEQDGRWSKAEEKLLQQMNAEKKFPAILNTKVNLKKVNMNVIERWINARIIQLTGIEDDITVNTIVNLLQSPEVNPKRMQISISAFLPSHSGKFMEELWTLLVDAQVQPSGIPSTLSEGNRRKTPVTTIPIPTTSSSTVDREGPTIPLNSESRSNDQIQEKDRSRSLEKERFNNRDRDDRKDRHGRDSRRRSPSPHRRRKRSPSPHRRRYDDSRSRSRDRNNSRRDERNQKHH